MSRFIAFIALLAALAATAAWYSQYRGVPPRAITTRSTEPDESWLQQLYSQNPREADAAAARVSQLGSRALPLIRATLQDPGAEREDRKAALKACSILGPAAAPAIPEVAAELSEPDLTAEAAIALSFMGRGAFAPLRDSLQSDDPVVRREALRSLGKLRSRAPLDSRAVIPLLLGGMEDPDPAVRSVAATYLGILHDEAESSVPALIAGLHDPDVEVRRASAGALGAFGDAAQAAIPALRKAAADPDEDLAREAGRALVKLQRGK